MDDYSAIASCLHVYLTIRLLLTLYILVLPIRLSLVFLIRCCDRCPVLITFLNILLVSIFAPIAYRPYPFLSSAPTHPHLARPLYSTSCFYHWR